MPRNGALTFSDIAGKTELLRVACAKCGRDGQYRVLRLMKEFGGDATLIEFKERLIASCPKRQAVDIYDRCGASFPGLSAILK